MSDAYWRYGEPRQIDASAMSSIVGKRYRYEYGNDISSSHDLANYFPCEENRGALLPMRDTESINASYERYLHSAQVSSYGGGQSARSVGGGLSIHPVDNPGDVNMRGIDTGSTVKEKILELSGGREERSLPPDASNTLFVEGLPSNCTRREVAHIFRPFVGYEEVRLVTKESRHTGGDHLVLCFVDFVSAAHAATALDALQGYKFDELDRDSFKLRLQFARHPGVRAGGVHRSKR